MVSKKKIMVVDDEPMTTEFLKTLLEMSGYDVIPILSGKECLDKLKTEKPDVILLDIMMPEVNGWEVLEKIEEDDNYKKIPVIIISAKDQPVDKMLAEDRYKVADYIVKPFSNKELIEKIKKIVGN
jgi:DNA-binding response OmpR family regulator